MEPAVMGPIGGRATRLGAVLAIVLLAVALGTVRAAVRVPYGQGLLWKIEQPGVAPSYLFGTMHVSDPRVRNLPAPVRAAFNHAQRTVFEIAMTDEVDKQATRTRMLPAGRTLDRILGPRLFDEVAALAAGRGIRRETMLHAKPWAIYMALSFPHSEISRSYLGEMPLDRWMQTNAQQRGTPVLGLESVGDQLSIFDDLDEADQVALLRDGLAEFRRIDARIEQATQSYIVGDTGALYTQFQEEINASQADFARQLATRLVDDRNRRMVERMQGLLQQGGTFIAVGALHLPGDQGILRLLQRRGYSIVRVY